MTPHIEARKNDIASTVIMPGDPLRAKFIAQNFLDNYKLVNTIRNIFAYTGYYKGEKVTVMASGMGMPSIGIYSYELFKFYNVNNIIRIGSCGAYTDKLNLYDLILVENCYSDSNFAKNFMDYDEKNIMSSEIINNKIKLCADKLKYKINVGTIFSSDLFYDENPNFDFKKLYENYNCLGVEMESFALFTVAKKLEKNASCILTVSDNLVTNERTTRDEREKSFTRMMRLALETALELK